MKQTLKYQFLSFYQKLKCDVRILVDQRSVWSTTNGDQQTVSLLLNPFIGISIDRPFDVDTNGARIRPAWNINDHLTMTKLNLPTMVRELKTIQADIMKPDMYSYTDNRLELNNKLASESRRVFMIGRVTIELSVIVISQLDQSNVETLLEGIKMKFNNDSSSVNLTINELDSLIFNLEHLNVDSIAIGLYNKYGNPANMNSRQSYSSGRDMIVTDISPMG